jgi:hypothetical protein
MLIIQNIKKKKLKKLKLKKMPFPNNGENHGNGIKNEKNIVEFLINHPDCLFNKHLEDFYGSKIKLWRHEGGTRQRMDASAKFVNGKKIGISIKNHERKGTFDWINTTKGCEYLKERIRLFKEESTGVTLPVPKKCSIRDEYYNIFHEFLDELITSKEITELLSKIHRTEKDTEWIIVNDKKSKRLIMLHESNLDKYCNPIHSHEFILKSTPRAKTSRQIWIKSADGSEINTNLRIRSLLNNGITALFKKTSVPCFKIQQDNVDAFIDSCDKIIMNY